MSLSPELGRLAELAGRWMVSPTGYVAALVLPVVLLGVADRLVRRGGK